MLVHEVLKRYGQIDLFCYNAGIGVEGDCCAPDRDWRRSWEVNLMAHVYAALGLAEWLSITYGDQGIEVSALCFMGVRTRVLECAEFGGRSFLWEDAIEPVEYERFLIAPHPKVREYVSRKAGDYDRWLAGMRRLQASMVPLKEQ